MPDFRVTDRRANDLRLREAGPLAAGIWMLAGSWSTGNGTDGWVAAHYVRSWPGGTAAAKKLVSAGLWSPHRLGSQDGWLFDQGEWVEEQRLAAEVARDRELAADRARRSRQARKDRDLRESGQLTTGLVGVPASEPEPEHPPTVTRDVTRDAPRTSPPNVTAHVTTERHGERALLPHPHPLPYKGSPEEEASGSERADDAPAAPSSSDRPHPNRPAAAVARRALSHGLLDRWPRPDLEALDRRCDRHAELVPGAVVPPCSDCARRRRAIEDALVAADHRDQDDLEERRAARDADLARARGCPGCDDLGYVLDPDPHAPVRRCDHLLAAGNDAGPPVSGHDAHRQHLRDLGWAR